MLKSCVSSGVCFDFATIARDSLCVNVQTHLVVNEATYLDNVTLFGSPLKILNRVFV